jgi:hypothetical protein
MMIKNSSWTERRRRKSTLPSSSSLEMSKGVERRGRSGS